MKQTRVLAATIAILFCTHCCAQDSSITISKSWAVLKTNLQQRGKIISDLVKVLSPSHKVDKAQLENAKMYSIELFNILNTASYPDKTTILLSTQKNHQLSQALGRALATLENDPEFAGNRKVRQVISDLLASENRIALSVNEYNQISSVHDKPELLFGMLTNQ